MGVGRKNLEILVSVMECDRIFCGYFLSRRHYSFREGEREIKCVAAYLLEQGIDFNLLGPGLSQALYIYGLGTIWRVLGAD